MTPTPHPKIFAIVNQKGGVGKTTTAINLAFGLARLQRRVLLLDMDPQGNTTSGVGIDRAAIAAGIYDVLIGPASLTDVILQHEQTSINIGPANSDLTGAEIELIDLPEREFRLQKQLRLLPDIYDYVLIDCPPALGLLTLNSLVAAERVIVPVQCEHYALEGLGQLIKSVDAICHSLNQGLRIEGAVLTMYDGRTNLAREVLSEVRRFFGDQIFDTIIPRNVRLAEAPSFGQSIFDYDPASQGARAYSVLAQELIDRIEFTNN